MGKGREQLVGTVRLRFGMVGFGSVAGSCSCSGAEPLKQVRGRSGPVRSVKSTFVISSHDLCLIATICCNHKSLCYELFILISRDIFRCSAVKCCPAIGLAIRECPLPISIYISQSLCKQRRCFCLTNDADGRQIICPSAATYRF